MVWQHSQLALLFSSKVSGQSSTIGAKILSLDFEKSAKFSAVFTCDSAKIPNVVIMNLLLPHYDKMTQLTLTYSFRWH